eukprot:4282738-Pleurochrysis_carterae.AAC.1
MAATDAVHRRATSTGPNVSHDAGSAMREKPPCVFPSAYARISSHYSQCVDTAGGGCLLLHASHRPPHYSLTRLHRLSLHCI